MTDVLLKVQDLRTYFTTRSGIIPAVDGISFSIRRGESVGMVGESGCGKSITSLSIMRLILPPGKIVSGEICFEDNDLLKTSQKAMRKIRGNRISMIFQEPMTSLNPVFTVGRQISENILQHQNASSREAVEKSVELLKAVGIPNPERRVKEYPHQLSGGMRQRVMIAMALSCNPSLLVADEPTTALDVTIQAQILELMKDLRARLDMAILIISHDLGVIAEMADWVLVMYAGKIVEQAGIRELLKEPLHPYTKGLLASIPRVEQKKRRLHVIDGTVPVPGSLSQGCRFHPRCEQVKQICTHYDPPNQVLDGGRQVRCWIGTVEYAGEVVLL